MSKQGNKTPRQPKRTAGDSDKDLEGPQLALFSDAVEPGKQSKRSDDSDKGPQFSPDARTVDPGVLEEGRSSLKRAPNERAGRKSSDIDEEKPRARSPHARAAAKVDATGDYETELKDEKKVYHHEAEVKDEKKGYEPSLTPPRDSHNEPTDEENEEIFVMPELQSGTAQQGRQVFPGAYRHGGDPEDDEDISLAEEPQDRVGHADGSLNDSQTLVSAHLVTNPALVVAVRANDEAERGWWSKRRIMLIVAVAAVLVVALVVGLIVSATEDDNPSTPVAPEPIAANWSKVGQDIDGEAAGDTSGHSVSLSANGTVVAIGARENDGNGDNSGHVRVHKFLDGAWSQLGQDIDGEAERDLSGHSVSLSADGTVVATNGNNGAGHVRVHRFFDGAWSQMGQDIDGEAEGDWFGWYVSLSADGTVVAVGGYKNDGNGDKSGHVRIYHFLNGAWAQLGKDINGEAAEDEAGWSVSLSADGTMVAVGAWLNDDNGENSGHVRVHKFLDDAWSQLGQDIDGEAEGDRSGFTVSLSSDGTVVAIGAPNYDVGGAGDRSGHARIFNLLDGTWSQLGQEIDGEAPGDRSGYSVSLSTSGTVVAISATNNDGNGAISGHVRIFQLVKEAWVQVGDDIDGEAAYQESGFSVSLSAEGTIVAIGARSNDDNGDESGHVRVYEVSLL